MNTPNTADGWMELYYSLQKETENAIKLKNEIEENYNTIRRQMIDLSAQRTDLNKQKDTLNIKKHDCEVILNKAKENVRRLKVEQQNARDKYFQFKD